MTIAGVPLSDVFAEAAPMIGSGSDITLAALQPAVMPRAGEPTVAFERTLRKLAGQVGLLVTDLQEQGSVERSAFTRGRLVAIAATLIKAANEAGVTLEAAAVKNPLQDRRPLATRVALSGAARCGRRAGGAFPETAHRRNLRASSSRTDLRSSANRFQTSTTTPPS